MFFFLLGILGGVLAVVLGLVLVQQGKLCLDWLVRTRRSLSRPPSYNTVAKPPRYSLCGEHSQTTQINSQASTLFPGLTAASPTSLYSNHSDHLPRRGEILFQDEDRYPEPPSYSQVHISLIIIPLGVDNDNRMMTGVHGGAEQKWSYHGSYRGLNRGGYRGRVC